MRLILVVVVLACLVGLAGTARADTISYYYGFNNLSDQYPTDCYVSWGSRGCANGGFNYWDRSGISKVNGDCIVIGFQDTGGYHYFNATFCHTWNGGEFNVSRSGNGAPAYNRAFCGWSGGFPSYVKCWAKNYT